MRLIDADALLNRIDAEPLTLDGGVDINDLEKIIKTQPTIEQKQGVLVAKKDVMETLKTTLADGILLDTLELRANDLPTIEPGRKTGRWILDETDNSIECDKCGCIMWANDLMRGDAHFCPNCGADMTERSE